MIGKRVGSGMVLGKFMPLHEGHMHLLHFAQMSCHRLTILVCSLANEPIPGEVRFQWVCSMFPQANVVHHYADIPQEPGEHPKFWDMWKTSIAKHCPNEEFDTVFGSEDYGWKLAEVLKCEYIPVNRIRNLVPISGTQMRKNPMKYWKYLPTVVRPYFVRRIVLIGPESVGKTTLSRMLAERFSTVFVDEYGRRYLEEKIRTAGYKPDEFQLDDIPNIARGQMVSEDSMAFRANKLLFCDTDLLTTTFWSNVFLGSCPAWIEKEAVRRRYNLTVLLSPEGAPHEQDGTRIMGDPALRTRFFEQMEVALKQQSRPYHVVSGDWNNRFETISELAKEILAC
jgi:HTH-type transcriptional regulator, transcriptional repressor of NAD biosynthesis genes